jgi:hypothetical protein
MYMGTGVLSAEYIVLLTTWSGPEGKLVKWSWEIGCLFYDLIKISGVELQYEGVRLILSVGYFSDKCF